MHPSAGVEKTYLAKVRGQPDPEALDAADAGASRSTGGRTGPAKVRIVRGGDNAWIEITIVEGRNHQVRRMLQAVGHPVQRLRRIRYGGVELGRLPVGRPSAAAPRSPPRGRERLRARGRGRRVVVIL